MASLAVSLRLFAHIAVLSRRIEELQQRTLTRHAEPDQPSELPGPRPLEGLRIALAIRQDHARPVFATLLKEHLLREDVVEVFLLPTQEDVLASWRKGEFDADIVIVGQLTCNGYSEVYYTAEITCQAPNETVCAVFEKPSGGDRPENLARELVTKLSGKLDELVRRNERRRAIGELHGE